LASYSRMAVVCVIVGDVDVQEDEESDRGDEIVSIAWVKLKEREKRWERSARAPLALARHRSARIKKTTRLSCRITPSSPMVDSRGSRPIIPALSYCRIRTFRNLEL
jgi:hypothetical protein